MITPELSDRTVTRARRIKARLITFGVALGVTLLCYLLLFLLVLGGSETLALIGLGAYVLVNLAYLVWIFWLLFARAQTPGYKFTKLVAVDRASGLPSGGKLFLRHLLQGVISMVTLGLGEVIICYVSYDGRTTWFDRIVGVVVVDRETPAGPTLAQDMERPVPPAIQEVRATIVERVPDGTTQIIDDVVGDRPDTSGDRFAAAPVITGHSPIQEVPGSPRARAGEAVESGPRPSPQVAIPAAHSGNASPPSASSGLGALRPDMPPADGGPGAGFISSIPFAAKTGREGQPPAEPASDPARPTPVVRSMAPVSGPEHTILVEEPGASEVPTIRFDDNSESTVLGALVLGRNPVPPANYPSAVSLAVEDPAMKISKTHLLLAVDGSKLTVTDLQSTNGVRLAAPGAAAIRIPPGQPQQVTPGTRVHLGSRWFEVMS
ncbi:MAG: hypothetical protein CSA84_00865 [Actinomycetales bacterium]|nr:MAG: hypothetical protein CSA84_00865 [Actinomycetales bacterium]